MIYLTLYTLLSVVLTIRNVLRMRKDTLFQLTKIVSNKSTLRIMWIDIMIDLLFSPLIASVTFIICLKEKFRL